MVRAALLCAAVALAGCGGDEERRRPDARPDARAAVVWAVGDAATKGEAPRPLARMITSSRFDRLLYLGDVYERGTLREFRRNYDPLYGSVARRTSPVVGNHEAAFRGRGYVPYWLAKTGRPPRPRYTQRVGGWELIALDSSIPLTPQVRWLRLRLRERTTCRIAFWHRPRYNAGTHHGDQEDMAPAWDALRGKAVAVLAGHEHNLQRLEPIDDIVQYVSGAGGRGHHPIDEDDERLAFGDDERFGALRMELRPGSATFEFVADDGSVLDRSSLACER